MGQIITRFPPSPTGYLHIGGVRTAIFNWLYAKKNKGKMILRIEDTDTLRSTKESTSAILKSLEWLGIDWDEGPFFQSERLDIYKKYIDKLIKNDLAYYCTCSSERLDEVRKKAISENRKPKYDGKCRDEKLSKTTDSVVRFKAPQIGITTINDEIKNNISFNNEELDDFIIERANGMPTYNLTVVVDDITMGINVIIRGDDHINNTPKQIMLYNAFNEKLPKFAHCPMVLGKDKTRLSKRHGAMSVFEYKNMGILPDAMINYLVRLGWSYKDQEFFTRSDLIEKFTLKNIGKSPSVFDSQKLFAINFEHIQKSDLSCLAKETKPFFKLKNIEIENDEKLLKAVETVKSRSKTLIDIIENSLFYFQDIIDYDAKAEKKLFKENVLKPLETLKTNLEKLEDSDFKLKKIEEIFKDVLNEFEMGFGKVAQPVRLALTGGTQSPGIIEVMDTLGKDETIKRLDAGIKKI